MSAFLEGWRRVLAAPALTIGVLLASVAFTVPLAVVLGRAMYAHLGSSAAADRALGGWNREWALEFAADSPGLGETFTHEILGFGGTLATISRLLDAQPLPAALAAAAAGYVLLWIFLSGGVLDRLARGRPIGVVAFSGACGVYGLRFLRLAIPIGACYWGLFRWLHPWLFGAVLDHLVVRAASEAAQTTVRAALTVVFLLLLMTVSLVADFAKVRIVVEDRHSILSAVPAAMRFIRRRPLRSVGLYLLNSLAAVVLARLWLQVAPGSAGPDWVALLLAETYFVARLWARLAFMASEVVFFQGELAHAVYTAAPEPVWPDSPAVEAIRNLADRRDGRP
jgi:hypothetical protein